MRVSRSQNLNSLGALDVTGETIFGLLAVESQSRQLRYATLVHFGDDEMMPVVIQTLPHDAIELLQRFDDAGLRDTRTASNEREICLSRCGRTESSAAFISFV